MMSAAVGQEETVVATKLSCNDLCYHNPLITEIEESLAELYSTLTFWEGHAQDTLTKVGPHNSPCCSQKDTIVADSTRSCNRRELPLFQQSSRQHHLQDYTQPVTHTYTQASISASLMMSYLSSNSNHSFHLCPNSLMKCSIQIRLQYPFMNNTVNCMDQSL